MQGCQQLLSGAQEVLPNWSRSAGPLGSRPAPHQAAGCTAVRDVAGSCAAGAAVRQASARSANGVVSSSDTHAPGTGQQRYGVYV